MLNFDPSLRLQIDQNCENKCEKEIMADFLTDIQMFTMVPVLPEHVLNSLMMIMNCFCGMVDQQKVFMPYFQLGPLSEILTIANL